MPCAPLGVAIAIDDFRDRLLVARVTSRSVPVSYIKIDRSFVATALDDPARGSGVVRAIIEIALALG